MANFGASSRLRNRYLSLDIIQRRVPLRNDRFRCVDRLPFINFPHAYAITMAGRCTRAKPRETSWNPVTSLVSLDDEFSCHGVSNVERSWNTKLAARPTNVAINSCRPWYRIRAPGELDYKLVSWDEVSRESWSINWKTLHFRLFSFSQRESLLVVDWFNETRIWVDQFYSMIFSVLSSGYFSFFHFDREIW